MYFRIFLIYDEDINRIEKILNNSDEFNVLIWEGGDVLSNYVFKNLPILQPVKITWYRLYILLNKKNILNMCNVFINFHRVQNKKFDFCNFAK
jgi:hypothetical protein